MRVAWPNHRSTTRPCLRAPSRRPPTQSASPGYWIDLGVDPLFSGLLVALNLETAFLSPPVAMSALYLKGAAPKHVTPNHIFAGMRPFKGIQMLAVVLLYLFPAIACGCPRRSPNKATFCAPWCMASTGWAPGAPFLGKPG